MKRTTYIILNGTRLPLTRPANDVVLDVFAAMSELDIIELANTQTAQPHARYVKEADGTVVWYARVQSRPNKRPRTVAQSPNAGRWVRVGTVEPTVIVTCDTDAEPVILDDLYDTEDESKWAAYFRRKEAMQRLKAAGLLDVWKLLSH